jgi:gamma-glutamylcyclotransferase (GGCT)/AIG2-like uncharacterized protein YtfP
MEYLFIYGTLLKDINSKMSLYLNENADFYNKGYFIGKLYNIGKYPGAIVSDDYKDKVHGNIFKLNNVDIFSILDDYEGVGNNFSYPNEYVRKKIKVYTDNEELDSWIYLYNYSVEYLYMIESGDYLNFYRYY